MDKEKKYQGFTVWLALVDCLPVILCGITLGILAFRMNSLIFTLGTVLIIGSGLGKCLWKFLVALWKKDVKALFYQMRILMPIGFLLLLLSLIMERDKYSLSMVGQQISQMPNLAFYLLGCAGMGCMVWFARHLDSSDAKSNWIEQLTNAAAQLCFLLGVML